MTMLLTRPSTKTFIPSMSQYDMGRQMYRSGRRLAQCSTDECANGWLDAEFAASQMYLREMESAGVPHAEALAGLDAMTAPGWEREPAIEDDYFDIRMGN